MNINDLRVFKMVANEQNLSKASRLLYMTPQGISKIIKNLENECNCELFLRTRTGMILSDCGKEFARSAERIENEYDEMRKRLLLMKQKERGVVDLLSAYGILRLLTPDCLNDFRQSYPEIEFYYREFPDKQVERSFLAQEGNVAFTLGDCDENLYDIYELESFPIKLLVNENHPLSQKTSVTIQDLKGEPLFIENKEFKIHDIIVNKCLDAGFSPNIIFETSGFSLCHKMVRENKGISVTVDFISDDMKRKEDGMTLLPFSDGHYIWNVCMLTRKGETSANGVDLFQKHVKKWLDLIRAGVITR